MFYVIPEVLSVFLTILNCSNFQIVGRGNDQVAMTSKFETREDFGELFCVFVCIIHFILPVPLKDNLFILNTSHSCDPELWKPAAGNVWRRSRWDRCILHELHVHGEHCGFMVWTGMKRQLLLLRSLKELLW